VGPPVGRIRRYLLASPPADPWRRHLRVNCGLPRAGSHFQAVHDNTARASQAGLTGGLGKWRPEHGSDHVMFACLLEFVHVRNLKTRFLFVRFAGVISQYALRCSRSRVRRGVERENGIPTMMISVAQHWPVSEPWMRMSHVCTCTVCMAFRGLHGATPRWISPPSRVPQHRLACKSCLRSSISGSK